MRIGARLAVSLASSLLMLPCAERVARAGAERPACGTAALGALGEIGCEIAARVSGLAPSAAVIGLAPVTTTGAPSLGPGIAVRVAVRVALALGTGAAAWPYVERDERARALPHGSRPLVLVKARLEGDRIAIDAEIVGPESKGGGAPTLARFVVKRAPDAEIRSFMPPVRVAISKLEQLVGSETDVLALACADPTHDGPPALATLGRARVTFGTLGSGRHEIAKSRRVSELVSVAAAPLREPLASVTFTPRGELLFGLSDRASALLLDADLAKAEALPGARLPWPGGGCSRLEELFVSPRVDRCVKGESLAKEPSLKDPLDAIAGANVTERSGRMRLVRAGRRASDATAVMTDGVREVRLERAGAQLAVGDLDGDGEPELVTSVDTSDPTKDAVIAYGLRGAGLEEKLRMSIPTGVRALAICPQRAAGMAPIAVAAGNGIWVIR